LLLIGRIIKGFQSRFACNTKLTKASVDYYFLLRVQCSGENIFSCYHSYMYADIGTNPLWTNGREKDN